MAYDNVKKLAKALDAIKAVGEKAAADGEFDLGDVKYLPELAGPVQDIYEVVQDKDVLKDEFFAFGEKVLEDLLA